MSYWIELHQSLITHRKTYSFALRLKDTNELLTVGRLAALWSWALDNAPTGDISNIEPDTIARVMRWDGDSVYLMQSLNQCGWVDIDQHGSTVLHNWEQYAGKLMDRKSRNAERMRQTRSQHVQTTGKEKTVAENCTCDTHNNDVQCTCNARSTNSARTCEATVPNQTKPNHNNGVSTETPALSLGLVEEPDKPKRVKREKLSIPETPSATFLALWQDWPQRSDGRNGERKQTWANYCKRVYEHDEADIIAACKHYTREHLCDDFATNMANFLGEKAVYRAHLPGEASAPIIPGADAYTSEEILTEQQRHERMVAFYAPKPQPTAEQFRAMVARAKEQTEQMRREAEAKDALLR